jgi:predicted Zn-dependent protease
MMPAPARVVASLIVLFLAAPATAQTARVGGVVRDEDNQPLRSVTVTATSPDASAAAFTATTDDRGRFSIAGLRPGTWSFSAQAPGYTVEEIALPVRAIGPPNPPLTFTLRQVAAAAGSRLGSIPVRDLQSQLGAADALFAEQRWTEALDAYRAVLARAPSLSSVNLQIAAIHRQRREYDQAIAAYRAVLATDPRNEKALVGTAMTRAEQGNAQAGLDDLLSAAAKAPAGAETLYAIGEIYRDQSKPEEAARWYQRAAETNRSWAKPRFRLGELALAAGNKDDAARHWRDVIAVAPKSPEAGLAKAALDGLGT